MIKRNLGAYRRDVYMTIMTEAVMATYLIANDMDENSLSQDLKGMIKTNISEALDPSGIATPDTIHKRLENTCYMVEECSKAAKNCADEKCGVVKEENLDIPSTVDLNDEEKELITTVIGDSQTPEVIATIRTNVANALVAEDKKAQEVDDAISLMKEKSYDDDKIQESINTLTKNPSSLMNGLLTFMSSRAITTALKENATLSPASILENAKEDIKNNAMSVYAIVETLSVLGIKKYSSKELSAMAYEFHNAKF